MPLSAFQKEVLAVLAANRSEESHFAGGIVLNAPDNSPRFSRDFDIFHEVAKEVVRASDHDVVSLRAAGFAVETLSPYGEWEKETTFRKARDLSKTHDVDALCIATFDIGELVPYHRQHFYQIAFRPRRTRRQLLRTTMRAQARLLLFPAASTALTQNRNGPFRRFGTRQRVK